MCSKNGFTLVELMVVIVIIGILAAVGAPRLSGFTNSAKCNEITKRFKEVMEKETIIYASTGKYEAYSVATIEEGLGLDLKSPYWAYSTTILNDGKDLTIHAISKKRIGEIKIGESLTVTNLGVKTDNTTNQIVQKEYLKSYFQN